MVWWALGWVLLCWWCWHQMQRAAGQGTERGARRAKAPLSPLQSARPSRLSPAPFQASLADLNVQLASRGEPQLPMNRFRPNLVVKGAPAWEEDGWSRLAVGAGDGAVEFEK